MSNASSNTSRLRLRLAPARGAGALPAKRPKRCVTTARQRLDWLPVSTSVGMLSPPEVIIAASLTPREISNIYEGPERSQNNIKLCHKLDAKPMGGLCTSLGT